MKKVVTGIILFLVIGISFYFAFSEKTSDIQVSQDSFGIETEKTYHHKIVLNSDSPMGDCFSGTCLTAENKGAVYNSVGDANWACGSCSEATNFIGSNMKNLQGDCISRMKFTPGVPLCLEADNGDKWDIVFEIWPQGNNQEFKYFRQLFKQA